MVVTFLELVVEIVKAQAAQRPLTPEELEAYIHRTATALRAIGAPAQPAGAAAPTPGAALAGVPAAAEEAPPAHAELAERPEEKTLTVEEAARALGRSKVVVYRYIHEGRLPGQRVGRSYRIRAEDVEALRQELGPGRRRRVARVRGRGASGATRRRRRSPARKA
jgi:excisionase family DNA binding protein